VVGIADVSNTLFWPSFSLELVTVINSVNNGLVRNSGVSHSTLVLGDVQTVGSMEAPVVALLPPPLGWHRSHLPPKG
jgi:hypothetical protein